MSKHDTYSDEGPVCPYCGSINSDDDLHESTTVECDTCEKPFYVEVEYSVSYSTQCAEGSHVFGEWSGEKGGGVYEHRFCETCDKYEVREVLTTEQEANRG